MVDFRIYRAGFAPALVAVVVLLFSLQGKPGPLPPVVATAEFDQASTMGIERQILREAPVRTPGSDGDAALADLVEKRFKSVSEGQVAEQRFSAGGSDLRNVILTLPGESSHLVVVMAGRDSENGPGAASSAAATAMLLELAEEMRTSRHTKTLVFVSTDGASDGALGAREFAAHYPDHDLIDGVVSLWQPGAAKRREPSMLAASTGPQSANLQLSQTAARALIDQAQTKPRQEGAFGAVAGLAFPSGLSESAALIDAQIPAIGLSSAGERPLPPSEDTESDASPATIGALGRAALLLAATLDGAPDGRPDHGPRTYITLAGNIVPGWTLALLALTLLVPAALAAVDGIARELRRNQRVGWAFGWSASRALPPFAALFLLYLLGTAGIVPRPEFPFDPGSFRVGFGEVIAMLLLAAVVVGGFYLMRGWRVPQALPSATAVPAIGVLSVLAVLLAWLANPYLALLLVPLAHVWLVAARRAGVPPWPLVLVTSMVGAIPVFAGLAHVAGRLDLGAGAPWQFILMVDDRQIGFGAMISFCLLAGCAAGLVALALRGPAPRRAPAPRPVAAEEVDASPIAPVLAADDQDAGA